jgi:Type VI secretion system VasI, EvfG, VC_A0118
MLYFLLYGVLALWVLIDSVTRKMGAATVLWVLGTVLLGPIILPIYLASRPLKQGEVREGGKAWNVLKNFAVLWTIAMVIATVAALMTMADVAKGLTSPGAQAGAGLGMLLGLALFGAVWFFPTMGAALIGFLLKKNTIVETGPTGPLVGQTSAASATGGWVGLIGFAVLGLIAVAIANVSKPVRPSTPATSNTIDDSPVPTSSEWTLIESADKMDNTPIVILRKSGDSGSTMVIRCSKGTTDAYVDTGTILRSGNVRIKFDEAAPLRQTWAKSTDDKALFPLDAITFARQLTIARRFMLEFTAFGEGTRTISFDVANLDAKLKKVSDACNWEAVDQSRARAKAAAEQSRAQAKAADAALRARLIQYVHACKEQSIGKWCWADPTTGFLPISDRGWFNTEEEALQDAMEYARLGIAFKNK